MMKMDDYKSQTLAQLSQAKKRLVYSYNKVKAFNLDRIEDEAVLEPLESFSSRFARFSDIAISKYFRLRAIEKDPAFKGSAVDLIHFAEASRLIESAKTWIRIRKLRNRASHEYASDDYKELYKELISLCSILLKVNF